MHAGLQSCSCCDVLAAAVKTHDAVLTRHSLYHKCTVDYVVPRLVVTIMLKVVLGFLVA